MTIRLCLAVIALGCFSALAGDAPANPWKEDIDKKLPGFAGGASHFLAGACMLRA